MSRKILVKVRPGARRTEILKENDDKFEIAVAARAEHGAANAELVRFLEKKFRAKVRIIRGLKSTRKILLLE